MSLQQTAYSLPNFSVYPSRDQRAPYGTIQNIPIIQAIDRFSFDILPVTLLKDGTFVILEGNYFVVLPQNDDLFRFFGGHKYISNGDLQSFKVINRAQDPDFPWVEFFDYDDESSSWSAPGTCDCLVIQWTTEDQGGNKLPIDEVYYRILPSSSFPLLAPQLTEKHAEFKAKRKTQLKRK
jgi:hypothetical protein